MEYFGAEDTDAAPEGAVESRRNRHRWSDAL